MTVGGVRQRIRMGPRRDHLLEHHDPMRPHPLEQHHPLLNPAPYSIQNPYIKKDLQKQSYLARVGNQNLSSP